MKGSRFRGLGGRRGDVEEEMKVEGEEVRWRRDDVGMWVYGK